METEAENNIIDNNERAQQFEYRIGDQLAFIKYERTPDVITLIHTEVPPPLEGRGLAARLARFALDYAHGQHLKVIPICPFVASYIRRRPQDQDLVPLEYLKRVMR